MAAMALYRLLTRLSAPLLGLLLQRRLAKGKEDPARIAERRGIAARPRPNGQLVWLHAASVGEAQSILALVDWLVSRVPPIRVLVTTGTVTSAQLLNERLPDRSFHQFVPLDSPAWVDRFLDHWRPDLALWVNSELWPNLLAGVRARGVPALLINARMSARSFANWRRLPGLARHLLTSFDRCLAQSEQQAEWLTALGARNVACIGNLLYAAAPLPTAAGDLDRLREAIAGREVWLAASTHPGEESIVAEVHGRLRPRHPTLLTIIVPRHPVRAGDIAADLRQRGLRVAQRSTGDPIDAADDVYLADTLGELGLFYRLAGVTLVGGTFAQHGGHNPLEPAQLQCAILHGPDMANHQAVADELDGAHGASRCVDVDSLAAAVDRLLSDDDARTAQAAAAKSVADAHTDVLERLGALIAPYLDGRRGAAP